MTTTTEVHPIAEALAVFATIARGARRGVPGAVVQSRGSSRWTSGSYHLVSAGEYSDGYRRTVCGTEIMGGGWSAYQPWESYQPDLTCKRCQATPAGREYQAKRDADSAANRRAYLAAEKVRVELREQRIANQRLLGGIAEVARLTDCAQRAGAVLVVVPTHTFDWGNDQ